jgi:predicted outer membrane protein
MLSTLVLMVMASGQGAEDQTTLPRQADTKPYETRDSAQGRPTDPLYDRKRVATDDPTFILTAVENTRQATLDAQGAAAGLTSDALRDTARAISAQNETTTRQLESLAKRKGWRLPQDNPGRASTLPTASPHRAGANFILNQITAHETTLAQFRAQIAGPGDAELKRTLKQALPGYEKNLARLLEAKP